MIADFNLKVVASFVIILLSGLSLVV